MLEVFLIPFNLLNARRDSQRIKKDLPINHPLNGAAYVLLLSFLCWLLHLHWYDVVRGLLLRQLTFDIPLNLMRGLSWSYDSEDPQAVADRLEKGLFKGVPYADEVFYFLIYILFLSWALLH